MESERRSRGTRATTTTLCSPSPRDTAAASCWKARPGAPIPDWGAKLGYDRDELAAANRVAIDMLERSAPHRRRARRRSWSAAAIGPRGDGYDPGALMTRGRRAGLSRLADRHVPRRGRRSRLGLHPDQYRRSRSGIARAAEAAGMPCVISFTLETDGRLPTGESLGDAIETVDRATAGRRPTT